ncbi:acyl-CoA carboxylase subunit epsilon [Microbacterium sp. RD1]|uniref:acyl-CoA carboxylase subunit epsilon n=1 Tax=Microbacterium sp. RD1 TaxID=3457313 RepID=UPI003FA5238B
MSDVDPAPDVAVDVRRGNPTEEELAALVAVVSEAFAEESAAATAPDAPRRSSWQLTARGLRQPLARERGWSGADR